MKVNWILFWMFKFVCLVCCVLDRLKVQIDFLWGFYNYRCYIYKSMNLNLQTDSKPLFPWGMCNSILVGWLQYIVEMYCYLHACECQNRHKMHFLFYRALSAKSGTCSVALFPGSSQLFVRSTTGYVFTFVYEAFDCLFVVLLLLACNDFHYYNYI